MMRIKRKREPSRFGLTRDEHYGIDGDTYIRRLVRKQFRKKFGFGDIAARQRTDYELQIITGLGYSIAFLMAGDICSFAKKKAIGLFGCGTVNGSIVAYLLGLTEINPLEHGLIFERFLNEQMSQLPFLFACPDKNLNEIIGETIKRHGADRAELSGERRILEYKGALCQTDSEDGFVMGPCFSIEFVSTDSLHTDALNLLNQLKSDENLMLKNDAAKALVGRLDPTRFNDAVIAAALTAVGKLNEGCLYVNELCTYVWDNKPTGIPFLDQELQSILKDTYGVLIFQEQVMKLLQAATGCSLTEANETRKILSKRHPKAVENERKAFISKAEQKQIPSDIASNVFESIHKMIHYSYCKAHAVASAKYIFKKASR